MVVAILGIIDILGALALFVLKWGILKTVGWILVIFLGAKALLTFGDFASIVDLACVLIFILAIFGVYGIWSYIAIVWLLQKGIFSLL
ncbi:hypothetical protein HZB88_03495 [archaeon]|nr:hypothetical protein [archaeon]